MLFLLLGLTLVGGPILADWYQHRKRIAECRSRVETFKRRIQQVPKLESEEPIDVTTVAELDQLMDAIGYTVEARLKAKQVIVDEQERLLKEGPTPIIYVTSPTTVTVADKEIAVRLHLNPSFFRPVPKEPKPFAFGESVASNQRLLIPGLLLMVVGSGLILGIRPRAPAG